MKKTPILMLTFVLLAWVLAACAPDDRLAVASASPQASTQEAIIYTDATAPKKPDKGIKISVQAPDGWTKAEDETFLIWYEKGANYLNAVMPWIPANIEKAPALAEYAREQIVNHFPEADVSEVQPLYLGSVEAARIELTIPVDEQVSQRQIQVFFFIGVTPCQVTGVYLDNDAQAALDIEAMIQSITIEQ